MSSAFRQLAKRVVQAGLPVPAFLRPAIRAFYRAGVFCVESSSFLVKLLWVEPILRSVCESVGTHLRAERLPYMRGQGKIRIGNHVNLSGRSCFYFIHNLSQEPSIEIGDRTFVGNGCTFSAGQRIQVGSDCLISALVRIHDNDGHPLDMQRRLNHEPIGDAEVAPVVIGDNVWVGAGATILKGVSVGDGSVIGTGAVVTADVPPGTVVAGNPGKVVKTLS